MPLTDSQRQAVECTGRPLFIQAGAGTGKTFTLTKRLAHGLVTGVVPGVDNLLTITFTNKAAGELLGRVRAELRACGLHDAALQVDAAWISTIHAMCQRILSEHALEAGIDPGAQMLDDVRSGELLGQALDEMMRARAGEEGLELLLSTLGGSEQVCAFVRRVVSLLSLAPHGAVDFDLGPKPSDSPGRYMAAAASACASARAELEAIDFASGNKTSAGYFEKVVQREGLLNDALDAAGGEPLSLMRVCGLLDQAGPFKHGAIRKEPGRSILDGLCDCLAQQQALAAADLSYAQCAALLDAAQDVRARHRALKQALGAIDLGDVLIEAYRLLDGHPEIARDYRDTFASIMIDEFQDTDALQVAIAKQLTDEGLTTLATVGDAQQSIYGFRGADLEVYRAMRDEMRSHGALNVALDTNFRSHSGILQFVEAIFSTPEYFGGEFLKVKPGPDNDRDQCWITRDEPRIRLALMAGGKDEKTGKAPGVAELRHAEADYIARSFEQLHEHGAQYGDMAILLRVTSNAQLYQDALRRRGIPCVVSGGSSFYTSAEVGLVIELLRFLENPDDDEALFDLLGSEVFDLSDDDLLGLAVARREKVKLPPASLRKKASLYDALCFQARQFPQGDDSPLVRAHDILADARARVGVCPLSSTVLDVVRGSGWQDALRAAGAAGAARRANIQRICDMLDDFEQQRGRSGLAAAEYFRSVRSLAQDGTISAGKPATMASPDSSAVQVMTFHASKGLEFPIVALAEYDMSGRSRTEVMSLTEEGVPHMAMSVTRSSLGGEYLLEHADDYETFSQASTSDRYLSHAQGVASARAAAEAQRLLYVALTRARELLIVMGHDKTFASKGELASGQFASMLAAAFPDGVSWPSVVRTRTGALVGLDMQVVQRADDESARNDEPSAKVHFLPVFQERPRMRAQALRRPALRSYSSIAERLDRDADGKALPAAAIRLRDRSRGARTVAPVGSAFHLVAQWLLGAGSAADEAARVRREQVAARRYGLDAVQRERLATAVEAWRASVIFERMGAYPQRFSEYAFCVSVRDVPLEGSIDVLCLDPQERAALIVDYKTGTSGAGEDLHDRYRLQASCYAYAVLSSGAADAVDITFVRVEAGMEQVRFGFSVERLDELADFILGAGA